MNSVETIPALPLEIRLMQTEDAPGVIELYKSVYGDEYPVKSVYDLKTILDQQEKGQMLRVIAVTEGKVIGQVAVYHSAPYEMLYEEGQGIVHPEYRNLKINDQCMNYAHKKIYTDLALEQLWGEAVCNHIYMQKTCLRLGYLETGIELDLMPASSYKKEQSSGGRVSTLLFFKTFIPFAQTLFLPECYEEQLKYIYSTCNPGHVFLPSRAPLPHKNTRGSREIYIDAGVARFAVPEAGTDLENYLAEQEEAALAVNACILQVYLNLSSPSVGAEVEVMRKHNYFLGGALPRWFGQDGLLLQKTLTDPDVNSVKLFSDRAKKILEMVLDDKSSLGG